MAVSYYRFFVANTFFFCIFYWLRSVFILILYNSGPCMRSANTVHKSRYLDLRLYCTNPSGRFDVCMDRNSDADESKEGGLRLSSSSNCCSCRDLHAVGMWSILVSWLNFNFRNKYNACIRRRRISWRCLLSIRPLRSTCRTTCAPNRTISSRR